MPSDNQSLTGNCDTDPISCCRNATKTILSSSHAYTAILISVLAVAFSLNVVILVAVFTNRKLHTAPNVFTASLAFSDTLLTAVASITACLDVGNIPAMRRKAKLQRVYVFFISFSLVCNQLNHLMISVERWLYICHPYLHQRVVINKVVAAGVILTWVIPFAFSFNLLLTYCGFEDQVYRFQFSILISFLHFSLSFSQFIIYGHITLITRQQRRRINKARVVSISGDENGSDKITINALNTWKEVRMFVIVFGSYFLFETPWIAVNIYAYTVDSLEMYSSDYVRVAVLFSLFQCYSNFVTYAVFDKDFREMLKQWLKRACSLPHCAKIHPVNGGNNF